MDTCFVHTYYVQGCPDCHSLRTSVYLRYARAACPTPDEQAKLDKVAERFSGPHGEILAAGYEVKGEVNG